MQASFLAREGQTVVLTVQLGVYGLEPLLKAAHKFTGRCFVHLERAEGDAVLCRLRAKQSLENPEHLAGEFCNEVLDQTLRAKLAVQTEPIRNVLLAQAFSRTNLIHPELDQTEACDDPAGIGRPDEHRA